MDREVMRAEDLAYFTSAAGEELLTRAAEWVAAGDPVRAVTALRKSYPADRVAAALEQAELRARARARFGGASRMLFTRTGLEQASGDRVARWRARRYAGPAVVADLCCGIGGDTAALAADHAVVAVDRDPAHARLAAWNCAALGAAGTVWPIVGEVPAFLPRVRAAFVDPGRREGGRRSRSLAAMSPPIGAVVELAARVPALGVKHSPALDERELAGALGSLSYELEYLSDGGECKEAVLWLGDLRGARRRASRVDAGVTLVVQPADEPVPVRPVGAWVYEPDPAAIRAGAVEPLAREKRLWKLDEEIAYLSGDGPVLSPWLRGYLVLEVLPFALKPLRAALRARGVGDLVVKKRGSAVDPRELRHRLLAGLPRVGGADIVVFLTRHAGKHVAILAEARAERGGDGRRTGSNGLGTDS
jgi:hypothetical protein